MVVSSNLRLGLYSFSQLPCKTFPGDKDFVFLLRLTKADQLVAGGGHVISLSHARQVNEFIREVLTATSPPLLPDPQISSQATLG